MMASRPAKPWRRRLHRIGGGLLTTFALLHLANHLVAVAGVAAHQQVLEALRGVYRHPWVEPLLLFALGMQWATGVQAALALLRPLRSGQRPPPMVRWQALSGLVLGSFLFIHVAAVLVGRLVLGLDTNFHFAAAGMHAGWVGFFVPYYFLGVSALGVHLGCAAGMVWRTQRPRLARTVALLLSGVGVAMAALLVLLMLGTWVPVNVPPHYLTVFP